jgi:glutathione-specific gamma-glutamylcyclotransferase
MGSRVLSLTQDHVARVHRAITDTGPVHGVPQHDDADYAEWVKRTLATHPAPDQPTWLFAYGSLIWKAELPYVAEQPGLARGWHRSFCLRMTRFRGTLEEPGLMMALDRGGQCQGILYQLPDEGLSGQLDRLFRREFTVKPITNMPRWLRVQTAGGPLWALGFVMNRASPAYAGRLELTEVARVLARACGHVGSGAEYLLNTVAHLEERGIRDSRLWQLQQIVAEEIGL